jgi:hypothetical protein
MKKYLIILVAITILLSATTQLQAGVSDAAVLFLRIAAGARAAGMGEAFVAVADDATTTHWNPAGLGMYPLASEYHTFKVDYNPHISDMALKILKGDLDQDEAEIYKNFAFRPDGIFRSTEQDEVSFQVFQVDRDQSVLLYVISNVNTSERDMYKLAVRAVAEENTGVSFEEINRQRKRLNDYYDSDEKETQINDYFEELLADWQELKVKAESIRFLDEKITFALEDNQITEKEYGEIMLVVDKAAEPQRSESVKVPYSLLLSLWKDYASPWSKNLTSVTLVENGLPEANYQKYDIWGLSAQGLLHFNGEEWLEGMTFNPKRNATLEEVLYQKLSIEEGADIEDKKMEVVEINTNVSWDRLNNLVTRLMARLPESGADNLVESLEFLKTAWLNLTLDQEKLTEFINQAEAALQVDGELSMETIDRLAFHAARVDHRRLPDKILIPFTMAMDSEPKSIVGMGRYLWIGTDDGLYRYDTKEKEWRKYTAESGLPSNKITSLSTYDDQTLWVATPVGLALYDRGSWQAFGTEAGLNDSTLYLVHAAGKNKVWAVSNDNFYRFNGAEWNDFFIYEASVNDTIQKIVRDFIGYSDQNSVVNATHQIKSLNKMQSDIPEPGQELKIPFRYSLTHKIKVMTTDSDGRLWLGTDYGVKILYDGRFTLFGYKPFTVEEEMTIEDIAADFLDTESEVKIDQLASRIRDFNGINTNKVPAGRTVYIPSNPLATPITSLMADGSTVYIGTEKGLVQYSDERFGYFYQEGLERQKTIDIISKSGETWYATPNKVVVFASAKSEITGMHANWLPELADDIYYEFLSYIHHLGEEWGTIGLNVTFLSYGELVRVNEYNEIMGTFNSFDMAIGMSYGKKMTNNLSAGLTAKWIYSRLSDQGAGRELGEGTGSSLGIDIGLLYRPAEKLTFGAAVTNLGPDISYIDAAQSDPLPRNLAIGLSYKLIDNPYNRLMLVGEINKMLTGLDDGFSEELKEAIENVGFEYWYGSFIAFRAGYIYDQVGEVKTPTLGVGIQYRGFRFDFAYIPSSDTVPLANTVRFSLTGRI